MLPFTPLIDMFASDSCYKLPLYVSRRFDPNAWRTDAFSFTWSNKVYLFPPIRLIGSCIKKFVKDQVDSGIMITPAWPGIPCLPLILSLLVSDPIFLPSTCIEGHLPTRHAFNSMAWIISCNVALQKEYLLKRAHHCSQAWPLLPSIVTSSTGINFINGLQKQGIMAKLLSQ